MTEITLYADNVPIEKVTLCDAIEKASESLNKLSEAFGKPRRIRCEYCGVLSDKNYGTCKQCGAPL